MGYKIKYEDMYSLLWSFNSDMNYLIETVDNYKSALDSYLNTSAMSGETADAVYSYFQEVHYVFLDSIKQIAQAFLDNFAGYKAGYYSIDLSTKFVLDEEGIEATKDKLADIYEIFTDESAKVNSAISDIDSIDGVEHYDAPGDQGIPTSHDNLNTKLTDLDTNISDFESTTVTSIDNSIETLMALFIKSLESLFVPSQVEPNRYVAGTFGENPYAAAEIYMNEILQENHDNNVEILNSIWENETELHELAEARKVQGIWKAVGGGVLIVVGVVCIVGTAGAATPIVVGGWVAGGGTIAFGAADLIEGGQDIYHGSTGDLDTSSFNYIRDTVFMGNQKVYDITEEVFSFAAGAMIPIGAAANAGTLTFRSGAVIVGKEALGEAAGYGGSYLAGQFTDNPTLKMLAGVGASILVGFAGEKIDTHFDLSGRNLDVPRNPVIDQVESGEVQLVTNKQKGNYGEIMMDDYYRSQGYERISLDSVDNLDSPIHQGIDGVYYNPNGNPPYVVAEAKYGTSRLGNTADGRQMSQTWIENRLEKAVGKELADDILFTGYQRQLVRVEIGSVNVTDLK